MRNIFKRSANGAIVGHHKATSNCETTKMSLPTKVVLPMSQHIGAPCTPCVVKGDKVFVGTLIGRAEGFVSSNIYSSVSGEVSAIEEIMMSNGNLVNAVVIIPDGEQTLDTGIKPPVVTDKESFTQAVKESGLVGLGGAGFPTFIKLMPKTPIDTLLINGAECEPFITADNREFLECSEDVLNGIALVKKYFDIKKVVIGIERNKPKAIDLMFSLTKGDSSINVRPLKCRYPQGAEKILIEECTGKEVPKGGLPSDVGIIVMNVTTISFISKYLKTGIPLVSKRITVDGDAVKNPQNVEVLIGTPANEIIDFCGGTTQTPKKILFGGPMMGTSICDATSPVLKQTNAILYFGEQKAQLPEMSNCIRCGRCINGCPMGLSPVDIAENFAKKDAEMLTKLNVDLCMECGTCSFVCPAKRPVSQTMHLAKGMQRKVAKK